MKHPLDGEIDRNFDVFQTLLPKLLQAHAGEFALMRNGAIVTFHPDESHALYAGRTAFSDGAYSVQEVTERPVDLGFFSHAINTRLAG